MYTFNLLPQDNDDAIKKMVSIINKTIDAFELESNALALGDELLFLDASREKQRASAIYQKAACEFTQRYPEFKIRDTNYKSEIINLSLKLRQSLDINMRLLRSFYPEKS